MAITGFQKKVVTTQDSLGTRLKTQRQVKKLSLSDAEHDTRIRLHYLEAIENDQLGDLPLSHCKGFIRRYAEYVGFSSEAIEQELASLYFDKQRQPFSPHMLPERSRFFITPKALAVVFSVVVLLTFMGYVTYQVRRFAAPPQLAITSPSNDKVVDTESMKIEGKTDSGALLTVDNLQASVDSDGTFSYLLTLRPGLNQVVVRSENRIKKQTSKVVSILYQPKTIPESSPTPLPSATAAPQGN